MTDSAKWDEINMAHTPIQATRCGDGADQSVLTGALQWVFPTQAQGLFSSLAEGTFAARPTVDYEKKILDWTPASSASTEWTVSSTPESALPSWETPPQGIARPQPQKVESVEVDVVQSMSPRTREESPIDVINTSAFAPPEKKEEESSTLLRPQPMRPEPVNGHDSLIMMDTSRSIDTTVPSATVIPSPFTFPAETIPGPSSSTNEATPPAASVSKGCYTRPPGHGPPPSTPTSGNVSTYVCTVCGFSCASKFHYNSHMNTHGDHQCTMCDYTSRTEGRLKKHMRESHTVEEQLAVGLELSPPSASAPHTPAVNGTTPTKEEVGDEPMASMDMPPRAPSPTTLSAALQGIMNGQNGITSLDYLRAITEKPLLTEGSTGGLLLMGNPLNGLTPNSLMGSAKREGERRGKAKQYKCKQCPHISTSKEEQWDHARGHIPSDKQLSCTQCNFVTEYKHHLEYHMRNHQGMKPFQCKKCSYTCVNKSMLNSHMKSHTNIYQFRCADCAYATKYCHSLKLHLKKYTHRRKMEGLDPSDLQSLSAESSPPQLRKDSTASICSSLSGPFTPFGSIKKEEPTTPLATPMPSFPLTLNTIATSQSLNYATQMLMRQHQLEQMMGMSMQPEIKCTMCPFACRNNEEMVRHNVNHFLQSSGLYGLGVQASLSIADRSTEDDDTTGSPPGDDAVSHSNGSTGSPIGSGRGSGDEAEGSGHTRRKSKPSRIDEIGQRLRDKASPDTIEEQEKDKAMETDEPAAATATILSTDTLVIPTAMDETPPTPVETTPTPAMSFGTSLQQYLNLNQLMQQQQQQQPQSQLFRFECQHCHLGFQDETLHQIHMGYHGYDNAFNCSRCGVQTGSSLSFNIHLLQQPHPS